jgi:hypothetical protein
VIDTDDMSTYQIAHVSDGERGLTDAHATNCGHLPSFRLW